ncbi:MAG: ChbG/HpnK family deacetylase [bacterium]
MKRLVINADDFGLSESVNRGIVNCLRNGVVSATTMLANFPASDPALSLVRRHSIDLGWHVNLTEGKPLSPPGKIPSLVNSQGFFHPLPQLLKKAFLRQLRRDEICLELSAQFDKVNGEVPISHLDGHEHVHVFPVIRDAVRDLVEKHRIPFVRLPAERGGISIERFPARFFLRSLKGSKASFWGKGRGLAFYGLSLAPRAGELKAWSDLLDRIEEDAAEVMVHPGEAAVPGEAYDRFPASRRKESERLQDPRLKALLQEKGFEVVSFRDLKNFF